MRRTGGIAVRVVCHPGPEGDLNQDLIGVDDETLEPLTHFARNRAIVAAVDLLIACPPCKPMPDREGTAYTVDQARQSGVPCTVIWPGGMTEERRSG